MGKRFRYAPALLHHPAMTPEELAGLIEKYGLSPVGCIVIPRENGGLKIITPHPVELERLNHALKRTPQRTGNGPECCPG
jgi:hypothetical protein